MEFRIRDWRVFPEKYKTHGPKSPFPGVGHGRASDGRRAKEGRERNMWEKCKGGSIRKNTYPPKPNGKGLQPGEGIVAEGRVSEFEVGLALTFFRIGGLCNPHGGDLA